MPNTWIIRRVIPQNNIGRIGQYVRVRYHLNPPEQGRICGHINIGGNMLYKVQLFSDHDIVYIEPSRVDFL